MTDAYKIGILESPYRVTLPVSSAELIIPRPTTVLSDPYEARSLLQDAATRLRQPTNIVNPVLSVPGVDQIPQPSNENTGIVPPAITDPAVTTTVNTTAGPQWLAWVKAHPVQAIAIAVGGYYLGKELFKPKRGSK